MVQGFVLRFRSPLSTLNDARLIRNIRDGTSSDSSFEKAWITEYVRLRDAWLASIPRLRATRYRTRFFLDQIKVGRWHLELPLTIHGVRLTEVQSTGFSLPLTPTNNGPEIPAPILLKQPAEHCDDRQAEAVL